MAEHDTDQADRTEAPTPRRLERARQQGQIAVSSELAGFAGLLGAGLALALLLPQAAPALAARLGAWLAAPGFGPDVALRPLLIDTIASAALLVVGVAGIAAAPALLAHLLQTGFLVSSAQLRPQWSRISPTAGLRRMFSPETAVGFLKNVLKFAVLGLIVWRVLGSDLARLELAAATSPEGLIGAARAPFMRVLSAVLAVLFVLTVLDVFWTRLRFTGRMRMSRQDLREEHKEAEGDPHLKAKLRRIREERSRRRMMADVKQAAVVVTNPTHYAIALAYDRAKDAAPRVIAKGIDAVALRIRAEAERHHVPIYRNPPLARALFTIDLGRAVPAEHYQAVAEVIAYVWRLKTRAGAAGAAGR